MGISLELRLSRVDLEYIRSRRDGQACRWRVEPHHSRMARLDMTPVEHRRLGLALCACTWRNHPSSTQEVGAGEHVPVVCMKIKRRREAGVGSLGSQGRAKPRTDPAV